MPERAEPAQHRCDHGAQERTIAFRDKRKRRIEELVERAVPAQHAFDKVGSEAADRQARHIRGLDWSYCRFARALHSTSSFLRLRQGYAKSMVMPTKPPVPAAPPSTGQPANEAQAAKRPLPEAAARALAEAAARRGECAQNPNDPVGSEARKDRAKEVAGRGGLDPTRYGDWEVNGLASDF
jgi:hypothetical protein